MASCGAFKGEDDDEGEFGSLGPAEKSKENASEDKQTKAFGWFTGSLQVNRLPFFNRNPFDNTTSTLFIGDGRSWKMS